MQKRKTRTLFQRTRFLRQLSHRKYLSNKLLSKRMSLIMKTRQSLIMFSCSRSRRHSIKTKKISTKNINVFLQSRKRHSKQKRFCSWKSKKIKIDLRLFSLFLCISRTLTAVKSRTFHWLSVSKTWDEKNILKSRNQKFIRIITLKSSTSSWKFVKSFLTFDRSFSMTILIESILLSRCWIITLSIRIKSDKDIVCVLTRSRSRRLFESSFATFLESKSIRSSSKLRRSIKRLNCYINEIIKRSLNSLLISKS
jgi:hypothetical protein